MENNTSYLHTLETSSSTNATITTFKWIVYMSIMLLAVLGNMLVIITLVMAKSLHGLSKYPLMLNLSVCDVILVSVSIPTTLVEERFGYFPFGSIACKIIYPLSTYTVNCIVFTLILITLERFTTIVIHSKYVKNQRVKAIILIHVLSLITVIPYIRTADVIKDGNLYHCIETWDNDSSRTYTIVLFFVQYGIPLPVMLILYSVTWKVIERQNTKLIHIVDNSSRRYYFGYHSKHIDNPSLLNTTKTCVDERQNKIRVSHSEISVARRTQTKSTLKMFTVVVIVFAICMLPNQITWFYLTFKPNPLNHMVETIFYWLTYSNSILNPWIYAGVNCRFRKAYIQLLKQLFSFFGMAITRERLTSRQSTSYL